MKYTIQEW